MLCWKWRRSTEWKKIHNLAVSWLTGPQFLGQEPLGVYAVAYRHCLEAEAKLAANYNLRRNVLEGAFFKELKLLNTAVPCSAISEKMRRSRDEGDKRSHLDLEILTFWLSRQSVFATANKCPNQVRWRFYKRNCQPVRGTKSILLSIGKWHFYWQAPLLIENAYTSDLIQRQTVRLPQAELFGRVGYCVLEHMWK